LSSLAASEPRSPDPATGTPARPTPADGPANRSALWNPLAHLRFWIVVALGLLVDLWSKDWAFRTLGQSGRRVLIPHVLEFQTMVNDGALFGIGGGQTTLFLLASLLALALVLWMFAHSPPRVRLLHVALGAILAGALGNMYDRMFVQLIELRGPGVPAGYYVAVHEPDGRLAGYREYAPRPGAADRLVAVERVGGSPAAIGHVRDFIKIPTKLWGQRDLWPWVFNVADMLLVGGVAILAGRLWREHRPGPARTGPLDAAAGNA
jgi:signal peptidase II